MKFIKIKKKNVSRKVIDIVSQYGRDILTDDLYASQTNLIHHNGTSIYDHCLNVACLSVSIASRLHLDVDYRSLVRGALLHDFFLYDWHENRPFNHTWNHPKVAFRNAEHVFGKLNNKERDIITKHMFPGSIIPPKYLESWIVNIADDISAVREIRRNVIYSFEKLMIRKRLQKPVIL